MQLVARLYFLIFWIPAVVAVASVWVAVSQSVVRRPLLIVVWCGAALLLQIGSSLFSPGWVAGLVLQTVLAVYLGIRFKLDA